MKVSVSSCIIPTVAVLSYLSSPTLASSSAGAAQRRFRVAIDPSQPIFSSCAEGSLVAQVLTSKGKAVPNKPLTLTIVAAARSVGAATTTISKTARTGQTGKATFNVVLTDQQKQRLAGQELTCSVSVPNAQVRGRKQVVPCPTTLQVCETEDCSGGSVICEGDIMYDSMCAAREDGMTEDDCVTEEYDPECERIAGYVKCTGPFGEYWFENYCIARSYGNSRNMCEYVDDSDVPDCARSGEVICDGSTYLNLCHALSEGIDEASCTPSQ